MFGKSVQITETSHTAVLHVDATAATAKMGVGAAGLTASMMTLNEWVALATLVFILMQIGLLIPKYWALFYAWRQGKTIKVDVE